jgi:cytochrome c oxidase subunit 2
MRFLTALGAVGALFSVLTAAASASVIGVPVDGQLGFQPAHTPVMEQIDVFHTFLLWIITAISVFVLALLVWVVIRYNAKSNPEPSRFSHNTTVEVIWTGVPILILLAISVPSFQLLYYQDTIPESDFTIKTIGNQWNWTYVYPDHGDFEFVSSMVADEDIASHPFEAHRNLTTDVPVVVPAGSTVRLEVTASDVIHNWAMPTFGIKMDAIPGRLNEAWFYVDDAGIYYGQCSELCGLRHAYMPIEVHVVPTEVFDAWVAAANEDPYTAADVLVAYYDEQRGGARLAMAQ